MKSRSTSNEGNAVCWNWKVIVYYDLLPQKRTFVPKVLFSKDSNQWNVSEIDQMEGYRLPPRQRETSRHFSEIDTDWLGCPKIVAITYLSPSDYFLFGSLKNHFMGRTSVFWKPVTNDWPVHNPKRFKVLRGCNHEAVSKMANSSGTKLHMWLNICKYCVWNTFKHATYFYPDSILSYNYFICQVISLCFGFIYQIVFYISSSSLDIKWGQGYSIQQH